MEDKRRGGDLEEKRGTWRRKRGSGRAVEGSIRKKRREKGCIRVHGGKGGYELHTN